MKRKAIQLMTAGAGIAAAAYCLNRAWRKESSGSLPYGHGRKLKRSIEVNSSADALYQSWRNLGELASLFDGFVNVLVRDQYHSQWTLTGPGGVTLTWDAEIIAERPGEMIGWCSLEGSQVDNAGSVRFVPSPNGRSTTVTVALQYNPPAGAVAATIAGWLGRTPESQIDEALLRFKEAMECGGSSSERLSRSKQSRGCVDVASEDSFPASDAPAWTGTTGPI